MRGDGTYIHIRISRYQFGNGTGVATLTGEDFTDFHRIRSRCGGYLVVGFREHGKPNWKDKEISTPSLIPRLKRKVKYQIRSEINVRSGNRSGKCFHLYLTYNQKTIEIRNMNTKIQYLGLILSMNNVKPWLDTHITKWFWSCLSYPVIGEKTQRKLKLFPLRSFLRFNFCNR